MFVSLRARSLLGRPHRPSLGLCHTRRCPWMDALAGSRVWRASWGCRSSAIPTEQLSHLKCAASPCEESAGSVPSEGRGAWSHPRPGCLLPVSSCGLPSVRVCFQFSPLRGDVVLGDGAPPHDLVTTVPSVKPVSASKAMFCGPRPQDAHVSFVGGATILLASQDQDHLQIDKRPGCVDPAFSRVR